MKPNPEVQEAMNRAMALLKENPEHVFTVAEVRRRLNDDSKSLNDALVNLARAKACPVIRVSYAKYVYVPRASEAARKPSRPKRRLPATPTQAHDGWFKVRLVPDALTAFLPLKDGEQVVVTEDDRYFILSELGSP